jgi:uncharacterized MAPEG superfamily protein
MNRILTLLVYMALVTWLTLLAASFIRAKMWNLTGIKKGFGNRDDIDELSPLAGRVDRTAKNTVENFIFFAALVLTAQAAGITDPKLVMGAELFFWARLVFIPVYYVGIPYLRTGVWLVSIIGMGMMVLTMLAIC